MVDIVSLNNSEDQDPVFEYFFRLGWDERLQIIQVSTQISLENTLIDLELAFYRALLRMDVASLVVINYGLLKNKNKDTASNAVNGTMSFVCPCLLG